MGDRQFIHLAAAQLLEILTMVIRTISKDRENLPFKRQNVVNCFCVAQVMDNKKRMRARRGSIIAEKRDDNILSMKY